MWARQEAAHWKCSGKTLADTTKGRPFETWSPHPAQKHGHSCSQRLLGMVPLVTHDPYLHRSGNNAHSREPALVDIDIVVFKLMKPFHSPVTFPPTTQTVQ